MSTTHALQQFRIAVALAAREGTARATESHWDEAGRLLTCTRQVSASAHAALEKAPAAATVAVGDHIRALLIRNGGSAKHYEFARSQSIWHIPHMKQVLDELVAAGSLSFDAGTRTYRIMA